MQPLIPSPRAMRLSGCGALTSAALTAAALLVSPWAWAQTPAPEVAQPTAPAQPTVPTQPTAPTQPSAAEPSAAEPSAADPSKPEATAAEPAAPANPTPSGDSPPRDAAEGPPPALAPRAPEATPRAVVNTSLTPAASSAIPTAPTQPREPAAYPVQDELPRAESPAPETPFFDAWLGAHGVLVSSPGFDAFSEDDALSSFSAGVGAALGELGSTRIAAVASVCIGGAEASYRGQEADLSVVRLSLGPELRLPFAGRFFAYGRLSPELLRLTASLADASSTTRLEQDEWLLGVDAAVGVSLRLADLRPRGLDGPLSVFARVEGGYAWTPEAEMRLSPSGSNGPIRSQPLALGDLSLSGVSIRAALGVGY